jgi:hypothetical protein
MVCSITFQPKEEGPQRHGPQAPVAVLARQLGGQLTLSWPMAGKFCTAIDQSWPQKALQDCAS